jgi:GNAT superfamily N-acetyltransferase
VTRARSLDDAAEFLRLTDGLTAGDPQLTLFRSVTTRLAVDPDAYPEHRLWVVEDDGGTVGAALRTPPFHLLLAGAGSAMEELVRELRAGGVELPGVNGPREPAERFAAVWLRDGGDAEVRMRLRLHRLDRLEPVPEVPGTMRPITPDEHELVAGWLAAFAVEVGLQGGPDALARTLRERASRPLGLVVWDDAGRPVSLAGSDTSVPEWARVGPVYTPPELRRRGYATALVAALTGALLGAGAELCLLYTDEANPTSNAVYRRIGYQPAGEAVELDFRQ